MGSSVTPVQKALDMGLRPSLSVDVECSLSTDLFTQMRVVLNIQRMQAFARINAGDEDAPAPITVRDVLMFATVDGARANGLLHRSGTITPGKDADLVVISADEINNLPLNHAAATVVLGADARNVEAVLVAGAVRKWGGRIVGHDIDRVRSRITASRDYVMAQAGLQLDVVGPASRPRHLDAH
jgi:cytosine/adenosine deaminase-related metal-dependent hydrolase